MPTYEMPLLMRIMSRPEITASLKRTAEAIFEKGGFIKKIDNLGQQATPYKISSNNQTHNAANYFIIHFNIAPTQVDNLLNECHRDIDIIRCRIYNNPDELKFDCTLHEELLPPSYRPEVQEMMKKGQKQKEKKEKHKFKFNTTLDYYPFQR